MILGILLVAGGFLLTKYGIAAIIAGVGFVAIALGLKGKSS